jgi:DEAD/DEAH box helicase domain-containing protein
MLHTGILPRHIAWARWFKQLHYVVIDEVHTYRGVFGSHIANVIRRLKRITDFYGTKLQFFLTSASLENSKEFAEKLIEEELTLIDQDGSSKGSKHFLIYNPPVINKELGLRKSAFLETVRLTEGILKRQLQTLIFARSRKGVEVVLTYLKENSILVDYPSSNGSNKVNPDRVMRGYRSGYLPKQRREIENDLRTGVARVTVATNALELGIDIGTIEVVIMVGFPGTIASTWQQAGRAGRGDRPSLAILICTPDPLDQFLAHHPDYFFERRPEQALIDANNPLVLLHHIQCAAYESPFKQSEKFGNIEPALVNEYLDFLAGEQKIHLSGNRYFWMSENYPASEFSLRSTSSNAILLQLNQSENPQILGTVDYESALWMVHPQAIYLHEGVTYFVQKLDLTSFTAYLQPGSWDYFTEPISEVTVSLLSQERKEFLPLTISNNEPEIAFKGFGEISVTSKVVGFRKTRWHTHEQLGYEELDLPRSELTTKGFWIVLLDEAVRRLSESGLWLNAPLDYGANWRIQRNLARARDNYRCQNCGILESTREHDVHHRIPFRTFQSFAQANELSNLVTLCHACHRRAETVVRIRSGLSGLSFLLGHIAPLFLMCDARDIGVHSDSQSPIADGAPTIILFDRVPAGIGLSQHGYEIADSILKSALDLVNVCPCADGCPSCVGPAGENGIGGKNETRAILATITTGVTTQA